MSREKKRFTQDIKAFVTLAGDKAQQSVRKIALGIFANVVTSSPVDTGRFRGNWQVGLSSKAEGTLAVEQKDPSLVVAREGSKLNEAELGTTIFISNNLPYANALEYGHSQQAPNGMVRTTFAALDQIVGAATK